MSTGADVFPAAVILTALEQLPADWRDLSDLLVEVGTTDVLLSKTSPPLEPYASVLLSFLRKNIDKSRVTHWVRLLTERVRDGSITSMTTVLNPTYPEVLRRCFDRAPLLMIKGNVSSLIGSNVAIVGSRRPSAPSRILAGQLGEILSAQGKTVVSGLADGIDRAAHEGAIATGGRTVAVLGCGLNGGAVTPWQRQLVADIGRRDGAVVSPYRPDAPATRSSYIARNPVISGMSLASIVLEGHDSSGSQSEAEASVRQGRPVLLWEPTLKHVAWATQLALNPIVHWVSSIEECVAEVQRASTR
jgi:DNA protecting protein DprA